MMHGAFGRSPATLFHPTQHLAERSQFPVRDLSRDGWLLLDLVDPVLPVLPGLFVRNAGGDGLAEKWNDVLFDGFQSDLRLAVGPMVASESVFLLKLAKRLLKGF